MANGTGGDNATSADPARAANGGKAPTDVGFGLPTWQEATGQLGLRPWTTRFNEHVWATSRADNLTDMVVRQTQQQGIGNMPALGSSRAAASA